MASVKTGNELLLLRVAVWGRVLTSSLGLALGASIFTNTSVLGVVDIPADVWTGITLIVGIIYIYFIYRTLVFAKNSGDQQINHPIRWLFLAFVPIANLYVVFTVLPRVFSRWVKKFSGISVSEQAVLVFLGSTTLINLVGQLVGSRVGDYELLGWTLIIDGTLGMLMAWTLRRALFGSK